MTPKEIITKMLSKDTFSLELGMKVQDYTPDACVVSLIVKENMVNGFQIAHGGITYALADSCLAFSANASGKQFVSIETSISHLKKVALGDTLTAKAALIKGGKQIKVYEVRIYNQDDLLVAHFKGTGSATGGSWTKD